MPIPADTEQSISAYGLELKATMYRKSFQTDLAAVRASKQASILAALFPPNASYFTYRPLDLAIRVLDGHERAVRTAFFQNLVGTSYIANGYRKNCAFCKTGKGNLEHLLYACQKLAIQRKELIHEVGTGLEKYNQMLQKVWARALREGDRKTTSAILFGSNYVVDGQTKLLFRKSRYKHFHPTDRICLATAKWLQRIGLELEELND